MSEPSCRASGSPSRVPWWATTTAPQARCRWPSRCSASSGCGWAWSGSVIAYSRLRGYGNLGADVGLEFRWVDLVVGAVAGIGTQLVLIPLLYLPFEHADRTLKHRLEAPAKTDTAGIHGAWQIAVLMLFLAVGAPIVEELFFRGLLLRSLSRAFGPVVGIAGSALVFGLAHFELLQLPALILFGVILGLLAHRTGRLGPNMVAHAAFNAVTVISLTITR